MENLRKEDEMERFSCRNQLSRSSKVLLLTLMILVLAVVHSDFSALIFSEPNMRQPFAQPTIQASMISISSFPDPEIKRMDSLLKKYEVADSSRTRVAEAIVHSSRKHQLDPRLVASIVIVESRANPFAISPSDAVGIMQIHVPTWAPIVDQESINLFKLEDNIDFGSRILRDHVKRYGLDEGIKRYNGWRSDRPETIQTAEAYLRKVHRIYGLAR